MSKRNSRLERQCWFSITDSRLKAIQALFERRKSAAITKRLNRIYAAYDLTDEEKACSQVATRAGFERTVW